MAQRRCESPNSCPSWARAFLAGIFSVIFLVSAGTESIAQYRRSTDGVRGPNVFVDMEVLRNLGPARTVPRVLQPTLRQSRMPGVRGPAMRLPNTRAPGSAIGRIVLKRPSSLRPRKSKRRASKMRASRLSPPKSAQKPKSAPRIIRPGPRPPAAPKIQSVRQIPAAPKPPRALVKPMPKAAAKRVIKPTAKIVEQVAPKHRKPLMPSVLARPPPPPRPSIKPPPMPRKTVVATPPPAKITRPIRKAAPTKPRQTASLPTSAGKSGAPNMVRLGFKGGQAKLPAPAVKQLDAIVARLTKKISLRLQLLAYADGATTSGSQARRLSLSRALAVRSYLIEKGIRSTRIDVRALGNQVKGSPADRVDVIINNR